MISGLLLVRDELRHPYKQQTKLYAFAYFDCLEMETADEKTNSSELSGTKHSPDPIWP
jgi:hypothetical protein